MNDRDSSVNLMQLERDRRLVASMLAGEEKALRTFMEEYFPRLYRYASRWLEEEADIDDVVQRVLSQAARRLETFRGESTLLTWLISICRREVASHSQKFNRHADITLPYLNDDLLRSVVETLEVEEDSQPERQSQRMEIIALIQFTLDQLPERYASVLELKYIEGLSSQEIAARLQTSDGAIQSLLARARNAFRELCDLSLQTLK